MGVHWLYVWEPSSSNDPAAVVERVCSNLADIKGSRRSSWGAQVSALKVKEGAQTDNNLTLVSFTERSGAVYLISEQTNEVLEADKAARTILEASQLLKPQSWLQCSGLTFLLGDFLVRVGRVGQLPGEAATTIFMLLDIEYIPVTSWVVACPILEACLPMPSPRGLSS